MLHAGYIKGTVTTSICPGCYNEPTDKGEVYLYDSDTALIDSVCISDSCEFEYRFYGLSDGTYYVQVKVAKGCPYCMYHGRWFDNDTLLVVIVEGGYGGPAGAIDADTRSYERTNCD